MLTFIINLDDSKSRMEKYNLDYFHRWRATPRDEIHKFIDEKMISYYNLPRPSHLGKCGCFTSHMKLYEHIVYHKLNDVLILEDDAVKVNDIPFQYPTDGITYVGGFIANKKMTDTKKDIILSTDGINKIDKNKKRILMTMSYIIPTWEIAEELLYQINSLDRYRAIDVLLGNININTYYNYPASFIESAEESTISTKSKKSNQFYEWVSISSK